MAQNIASPIGKPRISKWGALDFFIPDGKILRSLKLNSLHFATLIQRPHAGPCSWIIERTQETASFGPVITPSSWHHELKSRLEQPSSIAQIQEHAVPSRRTRDLVVAMDTNLRAHGT